MGRLSHGDALAVDTLGAAGSAKAA